MKSELVYLKHRYKFKFSGSQLVDVTFNRNAVSGIKAFKAYDDRGVLVKETRHPRILKTMINTKKSINLHIKLWAEGLKDGTVFVGFNDFLLYFITLDLPLWIQKAVYKQYYLRLK